MLSSSDDPSSLIYSLFYLYVWSRTLSEQLIEGISPRWPFSPAPGGLAIPFGMGLPHLPQVPTLTSTSVCL